MKYTFHIVGFITLVVMGYRFAVRPDQDVVYLYLDSEERRPAAIKRAYDFSNLSGGELASATLDRLLSDARILFDPNRGVGVELGHFVVAGPHGKKQFACDYFDAVEMTFSSSDLMVSGEPTQMRIRSDCQPGENIARMRTIWIPTPEILKASPTNALLRYNTDLSVEVEFLNTGDEWPLKWNLKSVTLLNSKISERVLVLSEKDLKDRFSKPVSLNWQPAEHNR